LPDPGRRATFMPRSRLHPSGKSAVSPSTRVNKIIAAAVLVAGCASAAGAQGSRVHPPPAAGELIRVTPESGASFTGRLAALGGDTLVLNPSDRDSAVMAVVSRERVEVHRSHRERWSGLGALAGIAAGLVASQLQPGGSGDEEPKKTRVAVVGGAAGGVVGGFFGFVLAPHQWQLLRAGDRRGTPPVAAPPTLPPPLVPRSTAMATVEPPTPAPAGSAAAPAAVPPPVPAPAPPTSTPPPAPPPARH
jgi:hypothetical protein